MILRWVSVTNIFNKPDHFLVTLNFKINDATNISKDLEIPKSVLYDFILGYAKRWESNDKILPNLEDVRFE